MKLTADSKLTAQSLYGVTPELIVVYVPSPVEPAVWRGQSGITKWRLACLRKSSGKMKPVQGIQ